MLLKQVEDLRAMIDASRQEIAHAQTDLHAQLTSIESRTVAFTESAKLVLARHIPARTEAAARRSIAQQGRAMSDAARAAFEAELGSTLRRLRAALQPFLEKPIWRLQHGLAMAASVVTWAVMVRLSGDELWGRGVGDQPRHQARRALASMAIVLELMPIRVRSALLAKHGFRFGRCPGRTVGQHPVRPAGHPGL